MHTAFPATNSMGETLQISDLSASPSLDMFAFLEAHQEKQWCVNCCKLHSLGRTWGLCCDLTRVQVLWSCYKHIPQFCNQEWHPGNPVLGAVLYLISTGHSFNPHPVVFFPILYMHWNSGFTSTLIFLLQTSHTPTCGIITALCLLQILSKRLEDGDCSSRRLQTDWQGSRVQT